MYFKSDTYKYSLHLSFSKSGARYMFINEINIYHIF